MSRLRFTNVANPPTPATGKTELFVSSADKHLKTIDDIGLVRDFIAIGRPLATLAAAAATSGTGETKLFSCQIPANYAAVGQSFRVYVWGNSSSTGTLIFRVRVGALGTIGDNQAWISTTSAAQVANARAGFYVMVTIRSIGAAGTVIADGRANAGAVVLPTLIAAPATAAAATNAIWYIDVSCTCSVGTYTAQVGEVDEIT